jgi:hypothetical protein
VAAVAPKNLLPVVWVAIGTSAVAFAHLLGGRATGDPCVDLGREPCHLVGGDLTATGEAAGALEVPDGVARKGRSIADLLDVKETVATAPVDKSVPAY